MKRLFRAVMMLILLLIIVLVAAVFFIDRLAKAGIEEGTGYALGVNVDAEGVRLDLLDGQLTMDRLDLANPEGFASPHLMQIGKFDLTVRLATMLSDTIVVDRFEVDGLDLNVEQGLPQNNVVEVIDHVRKLIASGAKPKREGKKVKVNRITIRNIVANFHYPGSSLLGGSPTVRLPVIELTDVTSDDPAGVAIHELAARVFPAVVKAVIERGGASVGGFDLKDLGSTLGDLDDLLGGMNIKVGQ